LVGYDLGEETVEPGDTVSLTLYWQAREPVEQRYKVFTHLLGETFNARRGSFLWGQQDNEPADGSLPTTTWRLGSTVVDAYAIPLDPDAPAGEYGIEVGLYNPATGERLPLLDAQGKVVGDHVVLTRFTVRD
jgi:hypothetical protein